MNITAPITAHAEAIKRWSNTLVPMSSNLAANTVSKAREASVRACGYHAMGGFHALGTVIQPLIDIHAASRDAEALAAIDAHADAIKLLVK